MQPWLYTSSTKMVTTSLAPSKKKETKTQKNNTQVLRAHMTLPNELGLVFQHLRKLSPAFDDNGKQRKETHHSVNNVILVPLWRYNLERTISAVSYAVYTTHFLSLSLSLSSIIERRKKSLAGFQSQKYKTTKTKMPF
jgi:hypothetical protein